MSSNNVEPTPARLPALDALRAVGAAAVVGTHVSFATGATADPRWGGLLSRLDVGVAIFFVLSGFLLFRPYAHAAAHGARPSGRPPLPLAAGTADPAGLLADRGVCLPVSPGNAAVPAADWLRYARSPRSTGRGICTTPSATPGASPPRPPSTCCYR